ncbi:39186_t:CDS:2, partial [Gigaspora margarita]
KLLLSISTNEFNKGSNSLKCASLSKYKKPNLVVLNDVNNEDFYHDEAINMNILDEIDEKSVEQSLIDSDDTNKLNYNFEVIILKKRRKVKRILFVIVQKE